MSLRVIADFRHHQLQMMAAHAMNGRRQKIAMAEHSFTPQLVVAKLRDSVMICVAETVSALVAIAAIAAVTVIVAIVAMVAIVAAAAFAVG